MSDKTVDVGSHSFVAVGFHIIGRCCQIGALAEPRLTPERYVLTIRKVAWTGSCCMLLCVT